MQVTFEVSLLLLMTFSSSNGTEGTGTGITESPEPYISLKSRQQY